MWIRQCKVCGKEHQHVTEKAYKRAIKRNKSCNSCARVGVKRTKEQCDRIQIATKLAMNTSEMKEKIKIALQNPLVKEKMRRNGTICIENRKSDPLKYKMYVDNANLALRKFWDTISDELYSEIQGRKGKSLKATFEKIGFKKMMSERYTGKNNPFYGKRHSQETKELLREISTNRLKNRSILYEYDTKPEVEFAELLDKHNIEYTKQFVMCNKIYDFHITKYNILVEIDGCYWHSKDVPLEKMNNHQLRRWNNDRYKDNIANTNNIRLIRIWDSDIKNFDITKEIINYE